MKNQWSLNKIKLYLLIILILTQTRQLEAATATVDGLKKLITKFADEDKSYITLYAAELGLDYDNYLAARRKQNSLEIKNYVLMFSPTLKGEALAGKIDQDKLDWVNNNCPGILPKVPLTTVVNSPDNSAGSHPTPEVNNSTVPVATTSVTTTAPIINKDKENKTAKSFHKIQID
ncbi:MAG: hypothetical protein P4L22_05705 [Candidatus Babeliales bacterium]|nr:hypothetical protein [Candidatus Babeliales bacterium]